MSGSWGISANTSYFFSRSQFSSLQPVRADTPTVKQWFPGVIILNWEGRGRETTVYNKASPFSAKKVSSPKLWITVSLDQWERTEKEWKEGYRGQGRQSYVTSRFWSYRNWGVVSKRKLEVMYSSSIFLYWASSGKKKKIKTKTPKQCSFPQEDSRL